MRDRGPERALTEAERYRELERGGQREWLDDPGVPYEFWSRVED